jgi:hypothetical protein
MTPSTTHVVPTFAGTTIEEGAMSRLSAKLNFCHTMIDRRDKIWI